MSILILFFGTTGSFPFNSNSFLNESIWTLLEAVSDEAPMVKTLFVSILLWFSEAVLLALLISWKWITFFASKGFSLLFSHSWTLPISWLFSWAVTIWTMSLFAAFVFRGCFFFDEDVVGVSVEDKVSKDFFFFVAFFSYKIIVNLKFSTIW